MRLRKLCFGLVSALTAAAWSHAARAEHSVANFPDEQTFAEPRPLRQEPPAPPPTRPARAESAVSGPILGVGPRNGLASERDSTSTPSSDSWRKNWLLSLEAVTHAPLDMGAQLGVETPQGLRLFGGYGWVPSSYMNLLTGIAANASSNSYAEALLQEADYRGHTWRVQVGWRPFRAIGLYADVGYAHVRAEGALDLASSGVPQLAMFGGGYRAATGIDMWLVELGYQGQLADRLVLGLALGVMGTIDSKTTISAVNGAPTSNVILTSAANQADAALEKYGYVPTLTLRLGFDLI